MEEFTNVSALQEQATKGQAEKLAKGDATTLPAKANLIDSHYPNVSQGVRQFIENVASAKGQPSGEAAALIAAEIQGGQSMELKLYEQKAVMEFGNSGVAKLSRGEIPDGLTGSQVAKATQVVTVMQATRKAETAKEGIAPNIAQSARLTLKL